MHIAVEKDLCCGAGHCVVAAPELFDQTYHDGLVLLLNPVPPPENHSAAREAVELCPTGAISLTQD